MASLPDPVLDKLRCYKCRSFLSCKPVSITTDGQSICGRCRSNNSDIPAVAYECVADYFLFPCKNWAKHCAYLLNLKDVIEHENDCPYGSTCNMLCFNPGSLCKSDNKLDLSQSIKFYNIPEQEILTTLTCTLCGYYLASSPIHVSANGTSMCHRCYKSKDGKVSANYVRHYALENILHILLFPCVYRKRGCTKVFKFGSDTDHEEMCSYSRTQKSFTTYTDPSSGKHKGVIETHSGHMFGTITPYSQFFHAQNKITSENYKGMEPIKVIPSEKQEKFFNELIKHRDSLQYQWNRNSQIGGSNSPPKIPAENSRTIADPIDEIDAKSVASSERPSINNRERPSLNKNDVPPSPGIPRDDVFTDDRSSLRQSPFQDNSYDNEIRSSFRTGSVSPPRGAKSTSSGSDNFNLRDSPESTISKQPQSPLRLNANDLMYTNSFNYQDRVTYPERQENFANNNDIPRRFPSQMQHNPSFRN